MQEQFPESFLTLIESFSIFASSCLSLKSETDFNCKTIPSLVLIIEKLLLNWKENWEQVEIVCKVLNFGLLQNSIESGKSNEMFSSLISRIISVLSSPTNSKDFITETDQSIELVCTAGTLLNNLADDFNWNSSQISSLYEMMTSVLNVLRHLLAMKSKNSRKVSNYLKLLISGIGALSKSTNLVHFIRREGILKTIFSLIRNYRDTESLILLTAGLCSKFDFLIEELLSTEILETFTLDYAVIFEEDNENDNDKLLLEFISLLSIIRIRFDTNCGVSEKICTVLYACNVQGRLDLIKRRSSSLNLKAKDLTFLEALLPLLKLLSNSLERSIEAPATEALLTNLSECFLNILTKLVGPDSDSKNGSNDQNIAISLIISTLLTFTLNSHSSKGLFSKTIQHLLFPFDQKHQKHSPSQFASAIHILIISETEDSIIENSKLVLKLNCPESLKNDLNQFLIEKKKN